MERPASPRGEELGRHHRLRRRQDFSRCYRQGRRRHGPLATLHVYPNAEANARLGVTASRKIGNSVVRHRVKRRVREAFRLWPDRSRLPALDVVVHLKPAVAAARFADLATELDRLLRPLTR